MNEATDAARLVKHMLDKRSLREAQWRRLSTWVYPARGKFHEDNNDWRNFDDLIRFTHAASQATLRGASGMTMGMTPRNASWFKPDFVDENMTEATGARQWLDEIALQMRDCLSSGGFYQAIQAFNLDLIWAGCALLYAEKGESSPLQFEAVQIGSFCVETDRRGQLLAVARRMDFTSEETLVEFGEANVSDRVKSIVKEKPWEMVRVWHLVRRENTGRFPVSSVFYEDGQADKLLRKSGYNEMPFFFTCWHEGHSPYGTGPGDAALPDAMQMDELERRKLQGLGRLCDPPMGAPTSFADHIDLAPGALNYMPDPLLVRPLLDLAPFGHALGYLREEIATVNQRLEQALFASIFASIPLDQRPRDMSATEFLERKRESLQQLGPVIAAYEPNVLVPLLYRVVQTLNRNGVLPPAPDAFQGIDPFIKMDFISPLANALRQTSAETTRALFQDVAAMAQSTQNPELLDKIDTDQMVDVLATGVGAPGSVIRSDEEVAQIRQQRLAAQQQQLAMQQQMQQAQIEETQARTLNQGAAAAQAAQEVAQQEGGGLADLFADM